MKTKFFFAFFFLYVHLICSAQKEKIKFHSINQAGIAWGATGEALQLQSINGIAYKTFAAGIGVALDYYWERTVPLFIDVRKDIFKNKKTPFVYADFGFNMPWVKGQDEVVWYKSNYNHGSYVDIGFGYKMKVYKKISANMSFGYSRKTLKEIRTNEVIVFDFAPGGNFGSENYQYTLRRFSLKAGLSF